MNTVGQNCPCPSPEIVAIPGAQGATGAAGTSGTNGVNAFTVTTSQITIPATNASTVALVANASWAVVGQNVFISDGTNLANFLVTAVQISPPQLTITALGYTGDTAASGTIQAGAQVITGGKQGPVGFVPVATSSANSAGSQALTTSPAQALATTLNLAGSAGKTYVLIMRVRFDFAGATFGSNQVVTATIRRTNNTGTNIASSGIATGSPTTITGPLGEVTCFAAYTTAGSGDTIQPFVSVANTPSAGALNVVESSIVALELT